MDKKYCEGCSSFYIHLSTLAEPDKQFTPTCTITGDTFVPISEIKKCTMKTKSITQISMFRPPMTFVHKENEWEFECLDCNGKGYEQKLSAGCTGYGMRRQCMACKGNGVVSARIHVTQEISYKKMLECSKDFTKNKQNFLGEINENGIRKM